MSDLARAMVIAAALLGGALVVRGTFGTDRFNLVPAIDSTRQPSTSGAQAGLPGQPAAAGTT